MKNMLILSVIGFIAQLIDGSLGMAYGVTSTTMLLYFGLSPAVASTSVHLSEVVTSAAAGISHSKFGNVNWRIVIKLGIPGSIGAFLGAVFLSHLPGHLARPYISMFLLLLGFYIFLRFLFLWKPDIKRNHFTISNKKSIFLGFLAGFTDATGGGGWGAITTPALLAQKGTNPSKVIGTVIASEFTVALSATLGFLISLGWTDVNWLWVLALMAGGIVASPIAAWFVKVVRPNILGIFVGGLLIFTNFHPFVNLFSINKEKEYLFYFVFLLSWIFSIVWSVKKGRVSNN
ncbi:MAG: sulfite exporter TauE/SafE family protein [Heyndrickxia sp.]